MIFLRESQGFAANHPFIHVHDPCHFADECIELEGILLGQKDSKHIIQYMMLPVQGGGIVLAAQRAEEIVQRRLRLVHHFYIRFAAMEIYKFIGIFSLAHHGHAKLQAHRAGDFQSSLGGILPRRVHVIGKDDFIGVFLQKPRLLHREGGPQRRHRIGDTVGVQGNGIHVAFHHNGLPLLSYFRQCLVNGKEEPPLIENGTFRRI